MRRRRHEYKECHSKSRFRDFFEASKRVKVIERNGGPILRPYECTVCQGYHLTSKDYRNA